MRLTTRDSPEGPQDRPVHEVIVAQDPQLTSALASLEFEPLPNLSTTSLNTLQSSFDLPSNFYTNSTDPAMSSSFEVDICGGSSREELLAKSMRFMTANGMYYSLCGELAKSQVTQDELDCIPYIDDSFDASSMLLDDVMVDDISSSTPSSDASTSNDNNNICSQTTIYSRAELLAVSVRCPEYDGMRYCLSPGLDKDQLTQEELDSIPLYNGIYDSAILPDRPPPDPFSSLDLLLDPSTPPEICALTQKYHQYLFSSDGVPEITDAELDKLLVYWKSTADAQPLQAWPCTSQEPTSQEPISQESTLQGSIAPSTPSWTAVSSEPGSHERVNSFGMKISASESLSPRAPTPEPLTPRERVLGPRFRCRQRIEGVRVLEMEGSC